MFQLSELYMSEETIFVPYNLCKLILKDLLTIHRQTCFYTSYHHTYKHPYNTALHTYILMHTCFFRPSPPTPTPTQLLLAAEVVKVKFDKLLFTFYHNQPVQCSPQSHVDSFYQPFDGIAHHIIVSKIHQQW